MVIEDVLTLTKTASSTLNLFDKFKSMLPKNMPEKLDLTMTVPKTRCRGLIAFVSKGSGKSSSLQAIQYHYHGSDGESPTNQLQYVYLLHSPGSESEAREIRKFLEETSIACDLVPLDRNDDVHNVDIIKTKIDEIANRLKDNGMNNEDIVITVAGGTVCVSLAMFIARLIHGFQFEIMLPNETDNDGRAITDKGSKPIRMSLQVK